MGLDMFRERVPLSVARRRLPWLVAQMAHPSAFALLTRRGQPVAALIPVSVLYRYFKEADIDEMLDTGQRSNDFFLGPMVEGKSSREVAHIVQQVQLTRAKERALLDAHGLRQIPGGELPVRLTEAPKVDQEIDEEATAKIEALAEIVTEAGVPSAQLARTKSVEATDEQMATMKREWWRFW